MLEPAIPVDEALRVDDLCRLQVLDTAAESRFDRITRTAARAFNVPIALVSLVDTDRQWFKSRQGLDAPQTPRNISFCAHAILNEGAFVIPDTLADPRFADNPLVTDLPHIRFYAGMPLHGTTGQRIGTLCLIDRVPRSFNDADELALADLAGWAELELNVYTIEQATAVAREKEERLQAILDNAGDGVVALAVDGRVLSINPAAAQMFGRTSAALVGTGVMDLVAQASRDEVLAFMTELALQPRGVAATMRREVQCLRAGGAAFPAEIVITRMRGNPEAFRERMFSRFGQADGSDVRAKPGTGLGLAISKAIVDRLGGCIGFRDREGGGTEFFVELPALVTPGETPHEPGDVLVCEDDPVIATLVCRLLGQGGLRADVAGTAADARRLLAAHSYRAMTLDISLPDEDGLSLLRSLRGDPATAQLPVVVLTARAAPDGVDATAFGALDWLPKPIEPQRLLASVRHAVRGPLARRPVVLHVEDDSDLVRVVGVMLEEAADTVHASSLAQARALLAEQPFSMILLDMQLPDGHASDLLAALPPRNAATPVVIFSGSEVASEVAAQVKNALVKSRTSSGQLLALLHRLIGPSGKDKP